MFTRLFGFNVSVMLQYFSKSHAISPPNKITILYSQLQIEAQKKKKTINYNFVCLYFQMKLKKTCGVQKIRLIAQV